MVSLTVNVNERFLEELKRKAEAEGKDVGDLLVSLAEAAAHASDDIGELSDDDEAHIAEGMAQLERGESIAEEDVMAKLRALR